MYTFLIPSDFIHSDVFLISSKLAVTADILPALKWNQSIIVLIFLLEKTSLAVTIILQLFLCPQPVKIVKPLLSGILIAINNSCSN